MSKQEVLEVLEQARERVQDSSNDNQEILVLLRDGDNYIQLTTPVKDAMQLIAALELGKFSTLQRISG